ncbi:organic hydroperoxide resistance protein [Amycolatopsis acidiphila]|uniref:Organic hydroperoxide resistance protein n=1 Tax=Amycolatopsis acidiphila TaxID=715473 RepID=A0A557ZTR6_9PSEU|nr:organic hydroperoxide resistance protein [Amycolatopsis acidiphila]TVT15416.1 organic hydroperoxide resistance protein [Amycolatopsis acidiphila]UIJ59514.1 organic hydroperoxide resistance protein [Amycolatopsis acidiphila]GHG80354.1 organic hydroperoxide resistance protein [Amycolatopsis acidiphila]
MVDALYTAVATARGDGRNGEVTSSDGVIDEQLAVPKEMGGPGGERTNPEQLFAAGYSACFHSALQAAARQAKVKLPDSTVTAEVTIGKDGDVFGLAVKLEATLPGLEQGQANELVAQAHQLCPYSRATRGNIEVEVTAKTS